MQECTVEQYLVNRIRALGGEVRKVSWPGRKSAPDRVVMLPSKLAKVFCFSTTTIWVEVKAPGKARTFPSDPRERAQAREHVRMRNAGQTVLVLDSFAMIDAMFPPLK